MDTSLFYCRSLQGRSLFISNQEGVKVMDAPDAGKWS